jgi:hypothetical protein
LEGIVAKLAIAKKQLLIEKTTFDVTREIVVYVYCESKG